MRNTSRWAAATIGMAMLVAGLSASAGVTVGKDRRGQLGGGRLQVEPTPIEPIVWGVRGDAERKLDTLNPNGDRNGDLWPLVSDSPVAPYHPWVVWSRFNGTDYDLAWSRWSYGNWEPIQGVDLASSPGDDLDPDLGFDAEGRPYLVFWREQDGVGQVVFSVFLDSRWMRPVAISPPGVDARYPAISGQWNRVIEIQYETPDGPLSQLLVFDAPPDTITDDINPQSHVRLKGDPVEVRPN